MLKCVKYEHRKEHELLTSKRVSVLHQHRHIQRLYVGPWPSVWSPGRALCWERPCWAPHGQARTGTRFLRTETEEMGRERERLELQHPNSLLQTIGQWLAYDQWHGNKILFSVYSTSLTCHNNVISSFLSSNDLHLKSFLHLKQILIYQLYTWPIKTLGLVRF